MPGVTVDLEAQVKAVRDLCLMYRHEYESSTVFDDAVNRKMGPGYGRVEAMALHGVIRSLRPKQIIEVGSGVSTSCIVAAARLNQEQTGHFPRIISIEPFPSRALREMTEVELRTTAVQDVPVATFESLKLGDFLFIDSSHVVKPGGDVNYLFLEVIPRLRPGVFIHIHDIYFPYDYPRDALRNNLHANESSLLHALLIGNQKLEVIFSLSMLHYSRADVLKELFPKYDPQREIDGLHVEERPFVPLNGDFPSSIYIRTR